MAKLISGAAPEWLRKATERAIRKAETAPQGSRDITSLPAFYSSVSSPPSVPSPTGVLSNQAVRLSLKASMPML